MHTLAAPRSCRHPINHPLRVGCVIGALTVALMTLMFPVAAGDLTTRDVVAELFNTAPGVTPDFAGKDLRRLDLAGVDFKGANLAEANLFGSDLARSNLAKVNLAGAMLDRATITGTSFADADMSGVSLLRPNIFSRLEAARAEAPDFARAKLNGAQLSGRFDLATFRSADLTGARFGPKDPRSEELITGRVELSMCDFTDAVLREANLSRTWTQYAKFTRADLRGANFAGANLKGADFSDADVTGANFAGAVLVGANFSGARGVDRANGLQEGLRHDGVTAAP